ncbi:hypothetical protein POM88_050570 [Heracleum sosnowskyi]|uniref:Cytochrome P450 n=1 Tax=Heracleum sosnowskyi TaxID=360622 RepID=A0AAD8H048_9APIA|nr:hypothetical protein POM88_050570 [Heracleum sosnowskyi]
MEQSLLSYAFSLFLSLLFCMITYVFFDLCLRAKVLLAKLQNQGIDGPKPGLILGNITEMQKIKSIKLASDPSVFSLKEPPSLDCSSVLFPHFIQWSKQYGKTFTFALGKKDRGPLLGKGLITTNREVWSHQRKTIASKPQKIYTGYYI